MAGISFLRDRSPGTPKMTTPQGPATRGSRRSRGSRSGFLRTAGKGDSSVTGSILPCSAALCLGQLSFNGAQELHPRGDELLHALVFQDAYDVVHVDADALQLLEGLLRVVVVRPDGVSADLSVVDNSLERALGHGVDRAGRDELNDVPRVVVGRVLHAGRGPQRSLRLGAS